MRCASLACHTGALLGRSIGLDHRVLIPARCSGLKYRSAVHTSHAAPYDGLKPQRNLKMRCLSQSIKNVGSSHEEQRRVQSRRRRFSRVLDGIRDYLARRFGILLQLTFWLFTTRREPTDGAAKACPPPLPWRLCMYDLRWPATDASPWRSVK